jgi:hypothetical protein
MSLKLRLINQVLQELLIKINASVLLLSRVRLDLLGFQVHLILIRLHLILVVAVTTPTEVLVLDL